MNTEDKKKYFAEAALALNREGFHAEIFHGGKLSICWDGEPLCEISDGGVVHYHNADLQTPERNVSFRSQPHFIFMTKSR